MKTVQRVLLISAAILALHHSTEAQVSYKDLSDYFIATWKDNVAEWERLRNIQFAMYLVFALISITTVTLQATNKGRANVLIFLTILVGLSTQVTWLLNIQPRKYQYAVDRVNTDLKNFQNSLFGNDLSDPVISADFLKNQQALEARFKKINDWLIGDQLNAESAAPPMSEAQLVENVSFTPLSVAYVEIDGYQCEDPVFDPEKSSKIKGGNFSTELPESLVNQMNADKTGLYTIGFAVAADSKNASAGVDECVKKSLQKFIVGRDQTAAKQQAGIEVAAGILELSENVWLRYLTQGGQTACVKIIRIPKSSLISYSSNVNSLKLRSPQRSNLEFKNKLMKAKTIN